MNCFIKPLLCVFNSFENYFIISATIKEICQISIPTPVDEVLWDLELTVGKKYKKEDAKSVFDITLTGNHYTGVRRALAFLCNEYDDADPTKNALKVVNENPDVKIYIRCSN